MAAVTDTPPVAPPQPATERPTPTLVEPGEPAARRPPVERETWWERWKLVLAAATCWALLLIAVTLDHLTATPHGVIVALYAGAYIAGGTFATVAAIRDLLDGHVNVDLLMVTAAIGAAIVGAWGEGGALLALFSTSNALEHHALERTHRAVRSLMELSPEVATVIRPELPEGFATIP